MSTTKRQIAPTQRIIAHTIQRALICLGGLCLGGMVFMACGDAGTQQSNLQINRYAGPPYTHPSPQTPYQHSRPRTPYGHPTNPSNPYRHNAPASETSNPQLRQYQCQCLFTPSEQIAERHYYNVCAYDSLDAASFADIKCKPGASCFACVCAVRQGCSSRGE